MRILSRRIFSLVLALLCLTIFNFTANAQTILVNYDFVSTTAGSPCSYGGPLSTAMGVTSSYTTSTGNCTTPAGTASTVPPAFVANAENQSVSITGFATGSTQYFQFQLNGVGAFSNYMVFFQTQRSATGPANATLQYSTDGVTFTDFQTISVPTSFGAFSFDLSAIDAIENQPTVYFRIVGTGGTGATGTFRIDNFQVQAITATAASATISGRVTNSAGRGLSFVTVTLAGDGLSETKYAMTNNFGYYRFMDVPVGEGYVVTAKSKRYVFRQSSIFIGVNQNLTGVDFIGDLRR